MIPDFGWARHFTSPFPHVWLPRIFPPDANDKIKNWLECQGFWKYTEEDFYRQFEFDLMSKQLPPDISFLTSNETLQTMTSWLQRKFNTPTVQTTEIVAHYLSVGQGMGIHNDYIFGGDTLRLLLQIGQGVSGGEIVLLNESRAQSISRVIHHTHGTGLAFAISQRSYHAVARVISGLRFTIVYSFRPV